MRLVTALLAVSLAGLLVVSPVAAHHRDGHAGGHGHKAAEQDKHDGSKQKDG